MRKCLLFFALLFLMTPQKINANPFKKMLEKGRKVMQAAFQMNFLPNVPVLFYKDSFNKMFEHTQKSIDQIDLTHNGQAITRNELFDDKALHIKKSAELALHIKSLIGSAHLAYGITMAIGLVKEVIDGSFLNPHGQREKADLVADHVGAMSVFGDQRFDKSLKKNIDYFVKPSAIMPSTDLQRPQEQLKTKSLNKEKLLQLYKEKMVEGKLDEAARILDLIKLDRNP